MSEKMPSPEELNRIQKENLTDEEIEKDKIREDAFSAGLEKAIGQQSEKEREKIRQVLAEYLEKNVTIEGNFTLKGQYLHEKHPYNPRNSIFCKIKEVTPTTVKIEFTDYSSRTLQDESTKKTHEAEINLDNISNIGTANYHDSYKIEIYPGYFPKTINEKYQNKK